MFTCVWDKVSGHIAKHRKGKMVKRKMNHFYKDQVYKGSSSQDQRVTKVKSST